MYKSPIELSMQRTISQLAENVDGEIFKEMARYGINVDKDELIKALAYDRGQYDAGYADGKRDAVVHGRWDLGHVEPGYFAPGGIRPWFCSECGYLASWMVDRPAYNYCPNCGAKMDLEEDNEAD